MTARDYEENVFSFGDIFDASRFQPTLDSGKVEVIVLESLWYKKYYFLCASKCGDIILVHFFRFSGTAVATASSTATWPPRTGSRSASGRRTRSAWR